MWPRLATRMSSVPSPHSARRQWPIEHSGPSRRRRRRMMPLPETRAQRRRSRCCWLRCPERPVSRGRRRLPHPRWRSRARTRRRLRRVPRSCRCQWSRRCHANLHLRSQEVPGAAPIQTGRNLNRRPAAPRLRPSSACCAPNRRGRTSQPSRGPAYCRICSVAFDKWADLITRSQEPSLPAQQDP
jgi:hypothetical protein